MPNVDFPSIRVSATRQAQAFRDGGYCCRATGTQAWRNRRIDQITSTNSLGTTSIQLQFAIGRNIDKAARDVRAAINASLADLPSDLPSCRGSEANTAAAPVFVLQHDVEDNFLKRDYDVADTVLAQRISQVRGSAK